MIASPNMFKNIFTKLPSKYVCQPKIMIKTKLRYSDQKKERNFNTLLEENNIIKKDIRNMGIVYLNRPNELNAMNWSSADTIYQILKEWETCKTHVVWKSNVKNIFSGGGDVKSVFLVNKLGSGIKYGMETSKSMHKLCYYIANYQKPFISIIDGLTFGGAAALAINGQFSVATENTIFSAPETAIGTIPDVGGTYKLSKLNGKLGLYLGLTGSRLTGSDVWLAGIATHFVPSSRIHILTRELTESDGSDINQILNENQKKVLPNKLSLEPYIEKINHYFSAPTVEEIIDGLKGDNSEWSKSTVEILERHSPTALKMTKRAFDLAPEKDFKECLKMEYSFLCAGLNADVMEGIRAKLVDKDNKPNWQPETLNEVTDEYINHLISLLPKHEELEL